jgi:hypothetical protein
LVPHHLQAIFVIAKDMTAPEGLVIQDLVGLHIKDPGELHTMALVELAMQE